MLDILRHAVLALPFAGTGWFLRGMCNHVWDRVLVGVLLLLSEAAVMVVLVG